MKLGLRVALAVGLLVTCRREPPACAPSTLASIEAAYVAESLVVCSGQTVEQCAALPGIEEKYRLQREAWITCH